MSDGQKPHRRTPAISNGILVVRPGGDLLSHEHSRRRRDRRPQAPQLPLVADGQPHGNGSSGPGKNRRPGRPSPGRTVPPGSSSSSSFGSSVTIQLLCQPGPHPASATVPPMPHPKFGRFSPSSPADSSANPRISVKSSASLSASPPLIPGSTPPPSSHSSRFHSDELPPRPSSTPQTRSHLTVSITARSGVVEPTTFGDLLDNNNKSSNVLHVPSSSSSSSASSVIKPAPIRLSPSDPVWRPF